MESLNEITKELYKKKPWAYLQNEDNGIHTYKTVALGESISFSVPRSEMGDNIFDDRIEAQLLIRWIV